MPTARIDKDKNTSDIWFRCSKCSHKLGRVAGKWNLIQAMPAIEIKCSSCRTINYIMVGGQKHE